MPTDSVRYSIKQKIKKRNGTTKCLTMFATKFKIWWSMLSAQDSQTRWIVFFSPTV